MIWTPPPTSRVFIYSGSLRLRPSGRAFFYRDSFPHVFPFSTPEKAEKLLWRDSDPVFLSNRRCCNDPKQAPLSTVTLSNTITKMITGFYRNVYSRCPCVVLCPRIFYDKSASATALSQLHLQEYSQVGFCKSVESLIGSFDDRSLASRAKKMCHPWFPFSRDDDGDWTLLTLRGRYNPHTLECLAKLKHLDVSC